MSQSLAQMVATARSETTQVPPAKAAEAKDNAELDLIVDVREPTEYQAGHVPGAINIPRGMLELAADPSSPVADARLSDHSAHIVVYCTKGPGARSLFAAQTLASMGYENVQVLDGGITAWQAAGLSVEGTNQPTESAC